MNKVDRPLIPETSFYLGSISRLSLGIRLQVEVTDHLTEQLVIFEFSHTTINERDWIAH